MLEWGIAAGAAVAASARWNWWRRKADGLPVLMYHKIGDHSADAKLKFLWVSTREFAGHLEYLKRHGYTSLVFSEMRDIELGRRAKPAKPVLITFDDGFANNYELAYPLLKRMGMKGNIFLVYDRIGGEGRWDGQMETSHPVPMLTWAQIREMRDAGIVEFGSHTLAHRNLIKATPEEARWELTESKKKLEQSLDREVLGFAYPWGEGADQPAVRQLVREAGYRYDFGTKPGISAFPSNSNGETFRRLDIRRGMSRLDFHLHVTRGRARVSRRFWE